MKIKDLYGMDPIDVDHNLNTLWGHYYNHVPEIDLGLWQTSDTDEDAQKRVTVKYYRNHTFDGRRIWLLASVWFGDKPVMVIQNAGREGDDHSERFVTNLNLYQEMVAYIGSILVPHIDSVYTDEVDPNEDRSDLVFFYGNHIDQIRVS